MAHSSFSTLNLSMNSVNSMNSLQTLVGQKFYFMWTDVIDHPYELTTYGKLFFTLMVKITHVRLDSLTMKSHPIACVTFFFMCVVNRIPYRIYRK